MTTAASPTRETLFLRLVEQGVARAHRAAGRVEKKCSFQRIAVTLVVDDRIEAADPAELPDVRFTIDRHDDQGRPTTLVLDLDQNEQGMVVSLARHMGILVAQYA